MKNYDIRPVLSGDKTRFSFELLPPVKGGNIESLFSTIDSLMEWDPCYINITYHREEVTYVQEGGALVPKIIRKRPGTVGIASAIQNKYRIPAIPHIICGGFSRKETEEALIDLHFLGIRNVLAIRGDSDKITGKFERDKDGHSYAVDLVRQIKALSQGEYVDPILDAKGMEFTIGVAGYPEKHPESPNREWDLLRLKEKVLAGGDYIVTQMFFDNGVFKDFVRSCREIGIKVPIIPGIKPLSTRSHLTTLTKTFGLTIPQDLVKEIENCQEKECLRDLGVEWAIAQSKELLAMGVPVIHFYTMGRSDGIIKIAKSVF